MQQNGLYLTIGYSELSWLYYAKKEEEMDKYQCSICGYVYDPEKGDPENGIAPGTRFEDLPDDWHCPVCGAEKFQFEKIS